MVCWHIQLERNARPGFHAQVQQAWTLMVGLERPARVTSREVGLLIAGERAWRAAIPDRAVLVPMMEAAAARRKRVMLPGPAGWGGRGPPWAKWLEGRGPPRRCSAAHPNTDGNINASAQRGAVRGPPQQPDSGRELFALQHSRPGLKRRWPPQNEQGKPEYQPWLYGIGDGRERGKRPHIGIS